MKKALIFSLSYYPLVGGAEVAIKEVTDRIDPDEILFHLITYRFYESLPEMERIGNVIVHRVGRGQKDADTTGRFSFLAYLGKVMFVPLAVLTAFRLQRIHRFSFFWSMMSYMVLPVVLLRMLGVRVPYLLTLQDGDPFEHVFKRPHIKPFFQILAYGFRRATAVHSISTFLLTWAHQLGYRGPEYVIPNGVDIERFTQSFSEEECLSERQRIGVKKDDILLVTTSRLVHKNGLDDVIRALKLLEYKVLFIVYGVGNEEDNLRALAEETGVADRVKFMGHIEHTEMPLALKTCDIFIRPSRSEGMGNSFIEAMAAELPVIATQVGGISDFLFDKDLNSEHQATGWAVNPNDPNDIARVVNIVISSGEEQTKIIRTARTLVVSNYDWASIASRMKKVFDVL